MRLVHNSLHDEVAARLRERIFAGELAPGSFLDEVALCAAMEISRTPLREALKVLTAEGLVRHEPRRGCFVNEVTERDLDEIFPVIALLEGRCAREAARRQQTPTWPRWRRCTSGWQRAREARAHQRLLRRQLRHPRGHHHPGQQPLAGAGDRRPAQDRQAGAPAAAARAGPAGTKPVRAHGGVCRARPATPTAPKPPCAPTSRASATHCAIWRGATRSQGSHEHAEWIHRSGNPR
jgi:DNA-binding transcriptional MocR family regulator